MAVTAAQVKELREKTGAGMLDCKNALTESDGDMEKAIDWLREKGIAKSIKKASRIAAEGLSKILIDGDNHFDEGRKGLENESEAKVLAFFSQPGAKKKFDKEYGGKPNISSKLVPPGDQAVDNQIKAMAGQLVKEPDQKVSIISQDKGFQKFAAKKNQHNTGDPIIVSRSVAKRKQRKKHKK